MALSPLALPTLLKVSLAISSDLGKGDEAAVIESVKTAGEINMAVAGHVVDVNAALADEPAKVNEDPQGAGWFFKVKVEDVATINALMDEAAYKAYVADLG
jgi:glycine cleavage system H protein